MALSMKGMFAPHIVPELVAKLRRKDDQVLDRDLAELIEQNHALGMPKSGFLYGGTFNTLLPVAQRTSAEKKFVHPSLVQAAKEHSKRCMLLNTEMLRITNGLSMVLRPCTDWQGVRDALPDALKDDIQEIRGLPRMREEAWALRDQPLQKHQYERTAELLLFYYANRMLY